MHLTLKKEATKPAAKNFLQQQAMFDRHHAVLQHDRETGASDTEFARCRISSGTHTVLVPHAREECIVH